MTTTRPSFTIITLIVCLAGIKCGAYIIKHIKDQTKEINQTEEICLAAVKQTEEFND